jgi:hypothetical protein
MRSSVSGGSAIADSPACIGIFMRLVSLVDPLFNRVDQLFRSVPLKHVRASAYRGGERGSARIRNPDVEWLLQSSTRPYSGPEKTAADRSTIAPETVVVKAMSTHTLRIADSWSSAEHIGRSIATPARGCVGGYVPSTR